MEKVFEFKNPSKSIVTADDTGVMIEHKDEVNPLTIGISKKIPYSRIKEVQFKSASAILSGFIRFLIIGGREQTGSVFNVSDDENTVLFNIKHEEIAAELKEIVEAKISENANNHATIINQISGGKGLLDMGVMQKAQNQELRTEN